MENYIFPFLWMRDQSEEILMRELEKISECGIGAVCLESRTHPDFGGEGWWHDLGLILKKAKENNMKIWILDDAHFPTGDANGIIAKKYPQYARKYIMMQHTDCVGPKMSVTLDVNLMTTKAFTWLDFGKPVNKTLKDDRKLLSVTAWRLADGDILGDDMIDLTSQVKDGLLKWDVPAGVWRLCVSFETYDFGARNEYINYIDSNSVSALIEAVYEPHYEHFREEFGRTIAGFFSDEPGFYNVDDFDMNDAIGRKRMALPWCDEMAALAPTEMGSGFASKLPLLWMPSERECDRAVRKQYMDLVSRLYEKNFSRQLGDWCAEHGVEYVGHVIEDNGEHCRLGCGAGHYFRAMAGQHMAGIDTIGGQIIPGNPYGARHGVAYVADGHFNHFGLARLGASAGQIDPKKKGRVLCEAFGAYGWSLGVRDMKWLVDYLVSQGVNHFVPHAFSMAEYPDADCPPHFYAGGHNPQFPYFAELMKYTNRMCSVFNGGMNVPSVAVLYPAEHDWMGECMPFHVPGQELTEHQIDYMLVPEDVFADREYYGTEAEDGRLRVNGRCMRCMIIPETEYLDGQAEKAVRELTEKGVEVIFVNRFPEKVIMDEEIQSISHEITKDCTAVSLKELAEYVRERGYGDMEFTSRDRNLLAYHYRKEGDIYLLFNSSLSETVDTELVVNSGGRFLRYDCLLDRVCETGAVSDENGLRLPVALKPYESMILVEADMEPFAHMPGAAKAFPARANVESISRDWKIFWRKSDETEEQGGEEIAELGPFSDRQPYFSGIIAYERRICIPENAERVVIEAEHVYETAELFVDGRPAGKCLTPPYRWEITDLCSAGEHQIRIETANTPARDVVINPGIFGPERNILEPSGMFGEVVIKWI